MDGARWQQIKEVFQQTFDVELGERAARLQSLCGGDEELQSEVARLLDGHRDAGSFLDRPPAQLSGAGDSTLAAAVDSGQSPARIGPYRLVRELGRGGMGVVYLAERDDPGFHKTVAIKILSRDSQLMLRRFHTETQILATLEHPGIARLYDGGATDDGVPYFVMEYVSGENILVYCDKSDCSLPDRLRLFAAVCDAVQYAHQSLIVHRDLKPSNILVTPEGEPKLLDFGIAKLLNPQLTEGSGDETVVITRLLTPQYASPEQVRGEPVTTASDVYSLGVILYELVCGQRPYKVSTGTPTEIERVVCGHEPPSPSSVAAKRFRRLLRGDLDTIVQKSLKKDPRERYATAAELAEDVRRHLAGFPVHARPDRVGYRTVKFVRRHRAAITAATVAALSLVGALGLALWQASVARAERDRARVETTKARQMATFLSGVFQGANPVEAHGQTVTARDLLDRGTASIATELKNTPDVQASLLLVMAEAYDRLAIFDKALELAEQSLALRRQLFPARSVEVAESLYAVGLEERRLGRPGRAVPYLEQALSIREELLGPNDPAVAQSLNSLAVARNNSGQAIGNQALLERAIRIQERATPASAALASLYNSLGANFFDRRDLQRARQAYEQSIRIYERLDEADRAIIATPLVNLGDVLQRQGDLPGAERLFQRALAAAERTYGKQSQGVAYLLASLGDVARARGDLPRAHDLLDQSLAMYSRTVPPDHYEIAAPALYLGRTLLAEGKPEEALPLLERALRIREKTHGPDHLDVAEVLIDVARARAAANEIDAGETLLRRALAIQRRSLPPNDPSLVPTLTALGQLLAHRNRTEAQTLLEEGAAIASARLPAQHSDRTEAEKALRAVSRR